MMSKIAIVSFANENHVSEETKVGNGSIFVSTSGIRFVGRNKKKSTESVCK